MAFHPYPQLIPQFCNIGRFGPPRDVTPASPWPWVAHPVSGLLPATQRPLQTRFRSGSACPQLSLATESNSLAHSPKGTPSGLPPSAGGIALRLLVSARFQVLFHSPHWGTFHLSLTVLVHYRSLRVFSLGRWTSQLPTGLACPVVLTYMTGVWSPFAYRGLTCSARPFQYRSARGQSSLSPGYPQLPPSCRTTPALQRLQPSPQNRFGLLPFRSPLLRESSLFLEVLRCFSSLRPPPPAYLFS